MGEVKAPFCNLRINCRKSQRYYDKVSFASFSMNNKYLEM